MNHAKTIARHLRVPAIFLALLILPLAPISQVRAAEFGTGIYILGYQSALAGYQPDPGFYLRNDLYVYQGNATIIALFQAGRSGSAQPLDHRYDRRHLRDAPGNFRGPLRRGDDLVLGDQLLSKRQAGRRHQVPAAQSAPHPQRGRGIYRGVGPGGHAHQSRLAPGPVSYHGLRECLRPGGLV